MTDSASWWHIEDARTGRRAGIATYLTRESAEQQITQWRHRDTNGGRPDIHDLIPHLVAVRGCCTRNGR